MNNVTEKMDISFDHKAPSIVTELPAYRDGYVDILKRGGRIRCLTDITKDNLVYSKKLLDLVTELRHFDGLKGGLAINGTEYMATSVLQEAQPLTEVVYSNVSAVVEQGQLVFDTFWDRAVPGLQRIKELEEGIEPTTVETLRDPSQIQKIGHRMAGSAEHEILVLFSSANAFKRQVESGLMRLLEEATKKPTMGVRILTPLTEDILRMIKEWKARPGHDLGLDKLEIRQIDAQLHTKLSIIIVDRSRALTVELKDDSKVKPIEAMGFGTFSNSKATVLSYCTIFDALWNQTELYGEIKRMNDQLQSQTMLQREFIDIAAHELRTPIQPILGMAEVLAEQLENSVRHKEMVKVIIRNAKRLQQLQEDILDVSKIESRSMDFNKELFSLDEVIAPVVEDAKNRINTQVDISFNPHRKLEVFGDKSRITQVVSNLITNALKFTKAGKIEIDIEEDISGRAIVRIRDTGTGIDPVVFSKLFSKFVTKSRSGTGLGLYIAKNIIEGHGGTIWAKNNENGCGATFTFTLPVSKLIK